MSGSLNNLTQTTGNAWRPFIISYFTQIQKSFIFYVHFINFVLRKCWESFGESFAIYNIRSPYPSKKIKKRYEFYPKNYVIQCRIIKHNWRPFWFSRFLSVIMSFAWQDVLACTSIKSSETKHNNNNWQNMYKTLHYWKRSISFSSFTI